MEMEFQSLSCLLDISFRKTFRQRPVRTAQKLFAVHSFDNLSSITSQIPEEKERITFKEKRVRVL